MGKLTLRLERLEYRTAATRAAHDDEGAESRERMRLRLDRLAVEQEPGPLDAVLAGEIRASLNEWLTTNGYPDLLGHRRAHDAVAR